MQETRIKDTRLQSVTSPVHITSGGSHGGLPPDLIEKASYRLGMASLSQCP